MKYKNLLKGIYGVLVQIVQVKDVKQKREKGHLARDQQNYLLAGAEFTEVQAQDIAQKPVLRASQLLILNMVAIQKSKKQKQKPELNE